MEISKSLVELKFVLQTLFYFQILREVLTEETENTLTKEKQNLFQAQKGIENIVETQLSCRAFWKNSFAFENQMNLSWKCHCIDKIQWHVKLLYNIVCIFQNVIPTQTLSFKLSCQEAT